MRRSLDTMAQIDVLKAQLVRDNVQIPWGFRLQGGTDYGQPITLQRVGARTWEIIEKQIGTPSEGDRSCCLDCRGIRLNRLIQAPL